MPYLILFLLHIGQIIEAGELLLEEELHCIYWAVAVLCHYDLSDILVLGFLVIVILTVEEHYYIRILLQGTGFTEVTKHRSLDLAVLYAAA